LISMETRGWLDLFCKSKKSKIKTTVFQHNTTTGFSLRVQKMARIR